MTRYFLYFSLWLLVFPAMAEAATVFPKLTGRVMDEAGMIDGATEKRLTDMLRQHEEATSNQVMVVTLPDLQGQTIETYGYQLGRHWGIGQENKNNGVLLIVAKKERKMRIEVGYGLEGALTDALAADIIYNKMRPQFKAGRFSAGIQAGTTSVLAAIKGEYIAEGRKKRNAGDDGFTPFSIFLFIVVLIFVRSLFGPSRGRHSTGSGYGGYRGGGGSSGGGGFSGGGGSFGGGGSSGGW